MTKQNLLFSKAIWHLNKLEQDLIEMVNQDAAFDSVSPNEQETPESKRIKARTFYTENIAALKDKMDIYKNNVSSKTASMFDLITGLLSMFASTDDRPAFQSIWNFFNGNGVLPDVIALDAASLYKGLDALDLQDLSELTNLGTQIENAESIEVNKREGFRFELQRLSMKNTLKNIFEIPEYKILVQNCPEMPEVGRIIYEDWEAAAVIVEYKLEIYIPSYVIRPKLV